MVSKNKKVEMRSGWRFCITCWLQGGALSTSLFFVCLFVILFLFILCRWCLVWLLGGLMSVGINDCWVCLFFFYYTNFKNQCLGVIGVGIPVYVW